MYTNIDLNITVELTFSRGVGHGEKALGGEDGCTTAMHCMWQQDLTLHLWKESEVVVRKLRRLHQPEHVASFLTILQPYGLL